MKIIYNELLRPANDLLSSNIIRWFDWDKGQLKKKDDTGRYMIAEPCLLVRISLKTKENITTTVQDCEAIITMTLAFDPLSMGRTAANAPEEVRAQGLEPYDVISEVYKSYQGFTGNHFDPLTRISAGELTHPDLFVYEIKFKTEFEDSTADT
ncbi:hypothetical protein M2451_003333 [Dysgonomonas sp. PFB1-18]|uniref:hypothetical protein n=1 Tax=unclassified Dysgonomonas TaxID=2630389 RepID=UPI002475A8C8|nr:MULTISPECIES: hypothetical protein [unclassified Dysgonomonas]MDH6310577.1 hypothetical protein [Dysgonomonas sp. PF1-14]MDH6340427.1 hypothetical protein [Dysgonomonas sp. PF1-16]MDH6381993.1 hypothetical protein [Dysgonomonas sp. PFB1-18]MDH6399398.1 hypothetical protein [Dysgonomonas sp. PF1-23]